jgi:N utilization substance protein A
MILDVGQIIAQLGKEKGIDKNVIIDAIKEALESAARKKFGANKILEATHDPDPGNSRSILPHRDEKPDPTRTPR